MAREIDARFTAFVRTASPSLVRLAHLLTQDHGHAQDVVQPALLRRLPPRMRAVPVLRCWADLTEADTAAALGCSVQTVRSQTGRGLARLRAALTTPRAVPDRRSVMDVEHLLRTTLADQARDTPDPAADLFERGPAARRAHRRRLADTDPWYPVAHVDGVGSLTG